MLTVTRHARERGVQRLGLQRLLARRKLAWLHGVAETVGGRGLPEWFRAAPRQYAPGTMYRLANYAGREVVLVEAPMPRGVAIVTLVTQEEAGR